MSELTTKTLVQLAAEIIAAASAGAAVKDSIGKMHKIDIPVMFSPLAEIFAELGRRDAAARERDALKAKLAEVREECLGSWHINGAACQSILRILDQEPSP